MNNELFEIFFPINTIYFTFEDKAPTIGQWEKLGFNFSINCYMFRRIG